jgi:hypothetical protein
VNSGRLIFDLSLKLQVSADEGARYGNTRTLAELELELPDEIAWELYRHAVERVTTARLEPAKS